MQTDMDSTNLYAYISIIALIVCIPPAVIVSPSSHKWETASLSSNIPCLTLSFFFFFCFPTSFFLFCSITQIEGPQLLKYGFNDAIAKVGLTKFVTDLFWVGMFYHLYNQVCLILPLNNFTVLDWILSAKK